MTVGGKPFTNAWFGRLTISDEMVVTSYLLNKGDMTVNKLLKLTRGKNTGTIKGDKLKCEIEEELINDNKITLEDLWFYRNSKSFVNGMNGIINANIIGFIGEELLTDARSTLSPFFQNKGTINASALFTDRRSAENNGIINLRSQLRSQGIFDNAGKIDTPTLEVEKGKFHNLKSGTLHVRGNTKIQESTVENSGQMHTGQAKYRKGKFTQRGGNFYNTGDWNHTGDVDIEQTELCNETGTMTWREGTWNAREARFYNCIISHWTLDQMICPEALRICNFGDLHFKNSTLTLEALTNYHTVVVEGGHYDLNTLDNFDQNSTNPFSKSGVNL